MNDSPTAIQTIRLIASDRANLLEGVTDSWKRAAADLPPMIAPFKALNKAGHRAGPAVGVPFPEALPPPALRFGAIYYYATLWRAFEVLLWIMDPSGLFCVTHISDSKSKRHRDHCGALTSCAASSNGSRGPFQILVFDQTQLPDPASGDLVLPEGHCVYGSYNAHSAGMPLPTLQKK